MDQIKVLKAEKQQLQKDYEYWESYQEFFWTTVQDKLTEIKHRIDTIDVQLLNHKKQAV
jgi:hypothetical protein